MTSSPTEPPPSPKEVHIGARHTDEDDAGPGDDVPGSSAVRPTTPESWPLTQPLPHIQTPPPSQSAARRHRRPPPDTELSPPAQRIQSLMSSVPGPTAASATQPTNANARQMRSALPAPPSSLGNVLVPNSDPSGSSQARGGQPSQEGSALSLSQGTALSQGVPRARVVPRSELSSRSEISPIPTRTKKTWPQVVSTNRKSSQNHAQHFGMRFTDAEHSQHAVLGSDPPGTLDSDDLLTKARLEHSLEKEPAVKEVQLPARLSKKKAQEPVSSQVVEETPGVYSREARVPPHPAASSKRRQSAAPSDSPSAQRPQKRHKMRESAGVPLLVASPVRPPKDAGVTPFKGTTATVKHKDTMEAIPAADVHDDPQEKVPVLPGLMLNRDFRELKQLCTDSLANLDPDACVSHLCRVCVRAHVLYGVFRPWPRKLMFG
jgi:hypothetical protein